jgi:hypothetical protein
MYTHKHTALQDADSAATWRAALREHVAQTAAAEAAAAKDTAAQHLAVAREPGRVMAKKATKWSVQALEIAEVSCASRTHLTTELYDSVAAST